MHELAIAQSIVASATQEVARRQVGRLKAIGLRVGALSGVLPDALDFSFEAITAETDLSGCSLAMEILPIIATCSDCADQFEVENFLFACPSCQSGGVRVTQGYELEISYLEVEDPVEPTDDLTQNISNHVSADSAKEESPF